MAQMRVKRDRVHMLTLLLTWLGCVHPLAAFLMVNWWSLQSAPNDSGPADMETMYYGTLRRAECYRASTDDDGSDGSLSSGADGDAGDGGDEFCETTWGFQTLVGQEAFSVSQLFAMFAAALCAMALVTMTLHTFLEGTLTLLTVSAFELGAAGLFGLLAVFVFLGFYSETKTDLHRIGPAFYLLVLGSSICLPAGGLSAWTAIKGGYYLSGIGKHPHEEDENQMLGMKGDGLRRNSRKLCDNEVIKISRLDDDAGTSSQI